ncbi:hypothetical protein MMC13_004507 [Lambiella insularis]|nr:hypothetical protein [Lambiella insularis]
MDEKYGTHGYIDPRLLQQSTPVHGYLEAGSVDGGTIPRATTNGVGGRFVETHGTAVDEDFLPTYYGNGFDSAEADALFNHDGDYAAATLLRQPIGMTGSTDADFIKDVLRPIPVVDVADPVFTSWMPDWPTCVKPTGGDVVTASKTHPPSRYTPGSNDDFHYHVGNNLLLDASQLVASTAPAVAANNGMHGPMQQQAIEPRALVAGLNNAEGRTEALLPFERSPRQVYCVSKL